MNPRLFFTRLAASSLVVCAVASRPAQAGFPLTSESSVSPCIVVCPAGDAVLHVVAKRNGFWSGDPVWVDFCGCPNVHFAPLVGGENYRMDPGGCLIVADPLPNGILDLRLEAGGTCSGPDITFSNFIPTNFIRTSVASPDPHRTAHVGAREDALPVIAESARAAQRGVITIAVTRMNESTKPTSVTRMRASASS